MTNYSWNGKQMMNPKGQIGTVIIDDNLGFNRILTIEFDDKTTQDLVLSNVSNNPIKSRKWKWVYERDGKSKWVEWGK